MKKLYLIISLIVIFVLAYGSISMFQNSRPDAPIPSTTKTFVRPEGTLAYDDNESDGDLVILLPGAGALRSEYRYLAPVLAEEGYRVVTVDLRGQGESSTGWPEYTIEATGRDILALIEYLDAGPAHVIGTSFSPGSAVWAAAEQPEAIRSLTMIGAFVRSPETGMIQNLMMAVLFNGPWKVSAWGMLYQSLYPTEQPDDFDTYLAELKSSLKEPRRYDIALQHALAPKTASEERLDQVNKPTLIVMGTKDPDWTDPVAEAEFIADALSGELVLIDGAGHYPQTEMPEQTTPAIVDFLDRNS